MNSLTTKLIIAFSALFLSIFVVGLWESQKFFNGKSEVPAIENVTDQDQINSSTYEKIIYTCKLGEEKIPAVQIAEVKDVKGNTLGVAAHVYQPQEINLFIEGAMPKWDYGAVSAQSESESIKITYLPGKQNKPGSWFLLLKGKDIYLKQNLRSCSEVSDE